MLRLLLQTTMRIMLTKLSFFLFLSHLPTFTHARVGPGDIIHSNFDVEFGFLVGSGGTARRGIWNPCPRSSCSWRMLSMDMVGEYTLPGTAILRPHSYLPPFHTGSAGLDRPHTVWPAPMLLLINLPALPRRSPVVGIGIITH
jgi:hypothetical protein